MTSFILIHGAGDSGWAWHLVQRELQSAGHDSVAPDLPAADDTCGLNEYADAVVAASQSLREHDDLAVVGHSLGGFTAAIVASQLHASHLIMHAAMIPAPGETPNAWWGNTHFSEAVAAQAALDGGLTGNSDDAICFYNEVPSEVAQEARARAQGQSMTPMSDPLPIQSWPDVPISAILCQNDRFFPAAFMRDIAWQRLGVRAIEVPGGHCSMLGQPAELAAAFIATVAPEETTV